MFCNCFGFVLTIHLLLYTAHFTGDVGNPPSDSALGPVLSGDDVDFSQGDGEVLFFAIGPYYVGGQAPPPSVPLSTQGQANLGGLVASNRAYGVAGEGT